METVTITLMLAEAIKLLGQRKRTSFPQNTECSTSFTFASMFLVPQVPGVMQWLGGCCIGREFCHSERNNLKASKETDKKRKLPIL